MTRIVIGALTGVLLVGLAQPAHAANREHQQLMADIRMLQEQSQQLQLVLVSLALFLSAIVMAPTWQDAYDSGIRPLLDQQMELPQAFDAASEPVKTFMLGQVDRDDLALFVRLSNLEAPTAAADLPLRVVTPAFMISELKRAFEIGFLLFVPFLVIDLVVASVLMSMGMMMLPPVVISLPFKLIFFVLVDGWRLVAGSLVESFQRASGTG